MPSSNWIHSAWLTDLEITKWKTPELLSLFILLTDGSTVIAYSPSESWVQRDTVLHAVATICKTNLTVYKYNSFPLKYLNVIFMHILFNIAIISDWMRVLYGD